MGSTLPVYLVHYDAPDWVRSATDSLLDSDIEVAVTVINNGPQDHLELDPRVTVVDAGANTGYAGGANQGLQRWMQDTDEPYCVVGAHDLHVEPDALRLLVDAADRAPKFGILGPDLDDPLIGALLGEQDGIEVRSNMNGSCLLMRRECIAQVGGFDEDFGSYGEDDELCFRAAAAGWLIGRVPEARGHGLGSSSPDRATLSYANGVLLLYKTRGTRAAAWGAASNVYRLIRAILARDAQEAGRRGSALRLAACRLWRSRRTPSPPRFT